MEEFKKYVETLDEGLLKDAFKIYTKEAEKPCTMQDFVTSNMFEWWLEEAAEC